MKLFSLLIAAALPVVALAQEPVEKPPAAEPAPLPEPPPSPESGLPDKKSKPAQENPLVPEGLIPATRGSGRSKAKTTQKPPTTAPDLEARIRFREAYGKAANDPKIQAMWEESRVARTDFDKRDALRRYYKALYKQINGVSKEKVFSAMVAERERVSLHRLDQNRIEPTDPLDEEHRNNR